MNTATNYNPSIPDDNRAVQHAEDDSTCYHCGLPAPTDEYTLEIHNQKRVFCCTGCQAVASMIHQGGLDQFYEYRSQLNHRPESQSIDYTLYDRNDIQEKFVIDNGDHSKTAYLLLDNISCAACVWLIEQYMQPVEGLVRIRVNASSHQCQITWDTNRQSLSLLMEKLANIGYHPQLYTQQEQQQQQLQHQRKLLLRLGISGFGMMQVGTVAIALYAGAFQSIEDQWVQFFRWLGLIVATPIVLFSAQPFWSAAWRNLKNIITLRKGHLIMDVPVSIAILLAYIASVWATISASGEVYFDSIAMFTFFLLLGRYMETRLRYRNQQASSTMTELLPLTVTRVYASQSSGSSRDTNLDTHDEPEEIISLDAIAVGDHVRIYSGNTIPCDGVVLEGKSAVIEAVLTGEAEPVPKSEGDQLIAGTVNTDGSLLMQVTATGEQTRLSTISRLVQEAEQDKPAVQKLADKVAGYFVATVLFVAFAVFVSWYFIEPQAALWVTLSVLVVTCPCALSLATPTALTAAVSMMRRQGLLVLKGHVVETLTQVSHVVFDKTGTLTKGVPTVESVILSDASITEENVLAIAAALEQGSSHPIAKAFEPYSHRFVAGDLESVIGAGVSGVIDDYRYHLGKAEYALGTAATPVEIPEKGQSLVLAKDGVLLAVVTLSDQLRHSASVAIDQLKHADIHTEILSGDSQPAVKAVADELQMDYCANQTPEKKLAYLRQQQQQQHCLMMVGDGINDVPVLAGADVSVAMDSATDFARTHADSVLMRGDLTILPNALKVAQKTKSIIRQNMAWALGYNLLALPLAAMGFIPPYLAAIGMSLSSLIVVFNALRLYRS